MTAGYAIAYRLGLTPWEKAGRDARRAVQRRGGRPHPRGPRHDAWAGARPAHPRGSRRAPEHRPPKSTAGRRLVAVPAALLPQLAQHLTRFAADRPDAVVFTGEKGALLGRGNVHHVWKRAREAAGLPEVHFHDLRHTGNTLTAQSGATWSDLMSRMGHSPTRAARIYLHTTSERDRAIAEALNQHVLWPIGHVAGTEADSAGEEVEQKGP